MKFREHRGGLAESLETLVELPDRAALVEHVKKCFSTFVLPPKVNIDQLTVTLYVDQEDTRIKDWKKTYMVEVPGLGPVGFTDGPVPHEITLSDKK